MNKKLLTLKTNHIYFTRAFLISKNKNFCLVDGGFV